MGFFDTDVENSFDSLFDMNRNGKLDAFEQGLQLEFLTRNGDFGSGDRNTDYDHDSFYDPDDSDDY